MPETEVHRRYRQSEKGKVANNRRVRTSNCVFKEV